MNKQLVIENIVLRFEALLPATCGTCNQQCLENLLRGNKQFPVLPGVTYWLCPLCAPTHSPPLTTQGGLERPKSRRKRLSPVENLSAAAAGASAQPGQPDQSKPAADLSKMGQLDQAL